MATTLEQLDRPAVDEAKLGSLVMKALGDFGATLSTAMISIGDRLGLYRAHCEGSGHAVRAGRPNRHGRAVCP